MKKILLYLMSGNLRSSWHRAIELSKQLDATLYSLYIIDREMVNRIAKMREKDKVDTAIEIEEEGWKYLYHLEEEATNKGVKTALFLEEGSPIDILKKFVNKRKIELLVVGYRGERGREGRKFERLIKRVIEYVPCPVLIEKEGM